MLDYLCQHKKKREADATEVWSHLDKTEKKEWTKQLKSKSQAYVDTFTHFVCDMSKEEMEAYTEFKNERKQTSERGQSKTESSETDSSNTDSSKSDI